MDPRILKDLFHELGAHPLPEQLAFPLLRMSEIGPHRHLSIPDVDPGWALANDLRERDHRGVFRFDLAPVVSQS